MLKLKDFQKANLGSLSNILGGAGGDPNVTAGGSTSVTDDVYTMTITTFTWDSDYHGVDGLEACNLQSTTTPIP